MSCEHNAFSFFFFEYRWLGQKSENLSQNLLCCESVSDTVSLTDCQFWGLPLEQTQIQTQSPFRARTFRASPRSSRVPST